MILLPGSNLNIERCSSAKDHLQLRLMRLLPLFRRSLAVLRVRAARADVLLVACDEVAAIVVEKSCGAESLSGES